MPGTPLIRGSSTAGRWGLVTQFPAPPLGARVSGPAGSPSVFIRSQVRESPVQFRQQALSKLQSPEELDLPVRFARPQGWLVLAVTVVVMAAASVWAVTGSVSSTVSAPAILTHGRGQLRPAEPRLRPGHRGPRRGGRPAARQRPGAEGPYGLRRVGRPHGRRGPAHHARRHDRRRSSAPGTNVATVEKVARADDPLYATVYVPAEQRRHDSRGRGRRPDRPVRAHPAVRGAARPCEVGRTGPPRPSSRSARSSATASSASSSPRRAGRSPSW